MFASVIGLRGERDRDPGAELEALGVLGGDDEREERVVVVSARQPPSYPTSSSSFAARRSPPDRPVHRSVDRDSSPTDAVRPSWRSRA